MFGGVNSVPSVAIIEPRSAAPSIGTLVMLFNFGEQLFGAGKLFDRVNIAMAPVLGIVSNLESALYSAYP
jgi:hypothetical protein